jgi:hypothetical protein
MDELSDPAYLAELECYLEQELDEARWAYELGGDAEYGQRVYRLEQELRAWTPAGLDLWSDFHGAHER